MSILKTEDFFVKGAESRRMRLSKINTAGKLKAAVSALERLSKQCSCFPCAHSEFTEETAAGQKVFCQVITTVCPCGKEAIFGAIFKFAEDGPIVAQFRVYSY